VHVLAELVQLKQAVELHEVQTPLLMY